MKITALAGGVGGAKLAQGFKEILSPKEFSVVVNTGDDFWHLGLYICPDLDTVVYTMAGIADPHTGWGINSDSFETLQEIANLGGPTWFKLGNKDIATHLERTRRIRLGERLTKIITDQSHMRRLNHPVLPMTDDYVHTYVQIENDEEIPFQEYFVKLKCTPKVKGFRFNNIERALPTEEAVESLLDCDAVVICPSNPYVSIDPILAFEGIREIITEKITISVSPIIQGKAIKGPLGKMFLEAGIEPNPLSITKHYQNLLDIIFIDEKDRMFYEPIHQSGIIPVVTDILIPDLKNRIRLASEIIEIIKLRI